MSNIKFRTIIPAILSALMLATAAAPADAYMTRAYPSHERIGMQHARSIALRVHPGTVTKEVLVRNSDGEERYVVVIRNRGGRYAVGVDAVSGRVVANVHEGVRVHRSRSSNFWDRLFAPTRIGN